MTLVIGFRKTNCMVAITPHATPNRVRRSSHNVTFCHSQGSLAFMMSASRQQMSRTANYYISASPVVETTKGSVRILATNVLNGDSVHAAKGRNEAGEDGGVAQVPR